MGEKKSLDIGSSTTAAPGGTALALTTTGSVVPLNLIAAGSSFFNRVGRKVEMLSVELAFQFGIVSQTVTTPQDWARILIVYDRQTNGANPTISDILQDSDSLGANSFSVTAGLNLNNRDRFLVIYDERIQLPGLTNTAGVLTNIYPNSFGGRNGMSSGYGNIHIYRKLRGLVTHYKADTATPVVGDIATGGLFIITLGALATGNFQVSPWKSRLRYIDT